VVLENNHFAESAGKSIEHGVNVEGKRGRVVLTRPGASLSERAALAAKLAASGTFVGDGGAAHGHNEVRPRVANRCHLGPREPEQTDKDILHDIGGGAFTHD